MNDREFPLAKFALISQFTGEVVGFIGLGMLIDWYWTVWPWGLVVFSFVGLAAGLFHLLRGLRDFDKPAEKGTRSERLEMRED